MIRPPGSSYLGHGDPWPASCAANPYEADWMAKPELGTKRVCVACGTRFYDLTKVRAVCPKCGTEQPIEQPRPRLDHVAAGAAAE